MTIRSAARRDRVGKLAEKMGRTRIGIALKASRIGLTTPGGPREKPWARVWKGMPEGQAREIFENFKKSRMLVGLYCKKMKFDDLGFSRTMKLHFPDEWDTLMEALVPKSTAYRLGRTFEYAVRNELRSKGYFVLRSPRSLGIVDLVAIKPGLILFIQCKRHGALNISEWNELLDLSISVGAIPILAARVSMRKAGYWKLDARKDGSKKRQPMTEYKP